MSGWGGPMRVILMHEREPALDLVCFCEVVTRDPFFLVGRAPRPDFKLADLMALRLGSWPRCRRPGCACRTICVGPVSTRLRCGGRPIARWPTTWPRSNAASSMSFSCSSRSSRSWSRPVLPMSGRPPPIAARPPTRRFTRVAA
ncbi:MAG: hypothetical protein WDO24_30590 [Pseudomonadota bacterium]